jgi:hypothetical protein
MYWAWNPRPHALTIHNPFYFASYGINPSSCILTNLSLRLLPIALLSHIHIAKSCNTLMWVGIHLQHL